MMSGGIFASTVKVMGQDGENIECKMVQGCPRGSCTIRAKKVGPSLTRSDNIPGVFPRVVNHMYRASNNGGECFRVTDSLLKTYVTKPATFSLCAFGH